MLRLANHRAFVLLALLQLGDIITTAIGINIARGTEGNPKAAALMSSWGQPAAYAIKIVGIGVVMLALYHYRRHRWTRIVLYTAIALSCYAVLNNIGFIASR